MHHVMETTETFHVVIGAVYIETFHVIFESV
jgi:hypothetical protein